MLTFTSIGKDVFPDAVKAAADMTSILGGDLNAAVIQVGKALNNPIEGFTALRRVGVSFTAAQEAQIKALQKSGNLLGAQKIILKELQTEFGGAAEAVGNTFAGKLDILKNSIGDLLETAGNGLLPFLSGFVDGLTGMISKIGTLDPVIVGFVATLGMVAVAGGPVVGILGAILGPVGLIATGLIALKTAWDVNFGGIRGIVEGVWNDIQKPLKNMADAVGSLFGGIFGGLDGSAIKVPIEVVAQEGLTAKGDVKRGLQKTIEEGFDNVDFKGSYDRLAEPLGLRLAKAITDAWENKLKPAIGDLGRSLWGEIIKVFNISPDTANTLKDLAKGLLQPLIDGFKNLSNINWGNMATAGTVIGAVAVGVLGFRPALAIFARMEAFKWFTDFLSHLSTFVDDIRNGDWGGALKEMASGLIAVGGAIALWNLAGGGMNILGFLDKSSVTTGRAANGFGLLAAKIGLVAIAGQALMDFANNPENQRKANTVVQNLLNMLEGKGVPPMPALPSTLAESYRIAGDNGAVGAGISMGKSKQPSMSVIMEQGDLKAVLGDMGKAIAKVAAEEIWRQRRDTRAKELTLSELTGPQKDAADAKGSGGFMDFGKIADAATTAAEQIKTAMADAAGPDGSTATGFEAFVGKVTPKLGGMGDVIAKGFSGLGFKMAQPFMDFVGWLGKLLMGIGNTQGGPVGLATFGAAIAGMIGWAVSRDRGGEGKAGQIYAIGKGAQPEVFIPKTDGQFIPNFDRFMQGNGGGTSYNFGTVNVYGVTNVQDFYDQLEREGKRRNQAWR